MNTLWSLCNEYKVTIESQRCEVTGDLIFNFYFPKLDLRHECRIQTIDLMEVPCRRLEEVVIKELRSSISKFLTT